MTEPDSSQDIADGIEDIRDIARTVKNLSADMVRVVGVEARLFGYTVLVVIGLAVIIALLLVGGWLFIGAAAVMALASLQVFNPTGALLTVALAHLALAALAYWRLRRITRDLTFPESRASVNSLLDHARSPADAAGREPAEELSESAGWRTDKAGSSL